ncbi:hypothetical protein HMPREF1143_1775 [Peptoanaerobacter stomatis]|uniref:Uncharacterized protein n=1 Tax=Peptoanaerobacter stomatis TaxID=796937 RepID=J6HBM5_9FIRM|nr:hypothetical protein [Peptoanaerobacter stomatis]EJU22530.1 hypothetical protein HMPREF1143_1775 [Peptoanaerobacter stomatis]
MRNLNQKMWKELTNEEQQKLMSIANAIDGRTGNNVKKSGDCIVDFGETGYSVAGRVLVTEEENIIEIDSEAVIYSPSL